jgi:hypothetical protein
MLIDQRVAMAPPQRERRLRIAREEASIWRFPLPFRPRQLRSGREIGAGLYVSARTVAGRLSKLHRGPPTIEQSWERAARTAYQTSLFLLARDRVRTHRIR